MPHSLFGISIRWLNVRENMDENPSPSMRSAVKVLVQLSILHTNAFFIQTSLRLEPSNRAA
ncbi:hypothetical protein HAX54_022050, partial [Datura stramonium]|nr:hypothetical protein [Datura stramonium]